MTLMDSLAVWFWSIWKIIARLASGKSEIERLCIQSSKTKNR